MGSKKVWKSEDEENLKASVKRIYSAQNVDELKTIEIEEIKARPKYHDFFARASEERHAQLTDQSYDLIFATKEKKARRNWLIFFSLNFLFNWFFLAIATLFDESLNVMNNMLFLVGFSIFYMMLAWIIFQCAYADKGTGLLTIILVLTPIRMLNSVSKGEFDFSMWYLTIPAIIFAIFYWLTSLRLRNINSEVKSRNQLSLLKTVM